MDKIRRKRGYWNHENIIKELKDFLNINGRLPLRKEKIIKSRPLYSAIMRNGGMNYFRKKIGESIIKNSNGYWDDLSNVIDIIKEKFPDLINSGLFPTSLMLRSAGIEHIILRHGGINSLAVSMNCKRKWFVSTDKHYLDSGNELIFDEFLYANKIPHEVHGLISEQHKYRYDFKIGDTYIEIWGYSNENGKFIRYNKSRLQKEKLYQKLNYKLISIEGNIFHKPIDWIEDYFKKIISQLNFDLNSEFLLKNFIKNAYYWNDESVTQELVNLINQIGEFPSRSYLESNKRHDLINAIRRNGGVNKFRKILECPRKSKIKYWNREKVQIEINFIVEKLGRFPKYSEISKRLKHQIPKYGGLASFKNLIG